MSDTIFISDNQGEQYFHVDAIAHIFNGTEKVTVSMINGDKHHLRGDTAKAFIEIYRKWRSAAGKII